MFLLPNEYDHPLLCSYFSIRLSLPLRFTFCDGVLKLNATFLKSRVQVTASSPHNKVNSFSLIWNIFYRNYGKKTHSDTQCPVFYLQQEHLFFDLWKRSLLLSKESLKTKENSNVNLYSNTQKKKELGANVILKDDDGRGYFSVIIIPLF